jgi:hypothetical protein
VFNRFPFIVEKQLFSAFRAPLLAVINAYKTTAHSVTIAYITLEYDEKANSLDKSY